MMAENLKNKLANKFGKKNSVLTFPVEGRLRIDNWREGEYGEISSEGDDWMMLGKYRKIAKNGKNIQWKIWGHVKNIQKNEPPIKFSVENCERVEHSLRIIVPKFEGKWEFGEFGLGIELEEDIDDKEVIETKFTGTCHVPLAKTIKNKILNFFKKYQ